MFVPLRTTLAAHIDASRASTVGAEPGGWALFEASGRRIDRGGLSALPHGLRGRCRPPPRRRTGPPRQLRRARAEDARPRPQPRAGSWRSGQPTPRVRSLRDHLCQDDCRPHPHDGRPALGDPRRDAIGHRRPNGGAIGLELDASSSVDALAVHTEESTPRGRIVEGDLIRLTGISHRVQESGEQGRKSSLNWPHGRSRTSRLVP